MGVLVIQGFPDYLGYYNLNRSIHSTLQDNEPRIGLVQIKLVRDTRIANPIKIDFNIIIGFKFLGYLDYTLMYSSILSIHNKFQVTFALLYQERTQRHSTDKLSLHVQTKTRDNAITELVSRCSQNSFPDEKLSNSC